MGRHPKQVPTCTRCDATFENEGDLREHRHHHCRRPPRLPAEGLSTRRPVRGLVYVFETAEGPRRAKIGFTRHDDVRRRFDQIQRFCPVRLIIRGCWEATNVDEARAHALVLHHRLWSEWFDWPAVALVEEYMESRGRRLVA